MMCASAHPLPRCFFPPAAALRRSGPVRWCRFELVFDPGCNGANRSAKPRPLGTHDDPGNWSIVPGSFNIFHDPGCNQRLFVSFIHLRACTPDIPVPGKKGLVARSSLRGAGGRCLFRSPMFTGSMRGPVRKFETVSSRLSLLLLLERPALTSYFALGTAPGRPAESWFAYGFMTANFNGSRPTKMSLVETCVPGFSDCNYTRQTLLQKCNALAEHVNQTRMLPAGAYFDVLPLQAGSTPLRGCKNFSDAPYPGDSSYSFVLL